MPRQRALAGLLLLVLALGMGWVGWRFMAAGPGATCAICSRPVHAHSRVEAQTADGQAIELCCPACGLAHQEQSGTGVLITRLTDYSSGAALSPREASLVVGSDVNLCMRNHALHDQSKETADLQFDRCSPSMFAFGDLPAARAFQAEHGGRLTTVQALESAAP